MKLSFAIAASVLALAACQPARAPELDGKPPESAAAAPAGDAVAGCNAKAEAAWGPIGPSDHPSYRIEAFTNGSICEAAVVTLVIRARDGFPVYIWASDAQHLFGLADQPDVAAMNTALAEWMSPTGSTVQTTGDLPVWEETDGQAKAAEFPFMPSEWLDKPAYDTIRAAKEPAYCFPQGMESLNCVSLRDGSVEEIGLYRFPG
ncbi:MAG: hypothetical protein B7Y90_18365 [Alphaproteobacteria bacterium 32-64-14]|nr:MAG: hypothetical protein B7Y90_18365 [Alphaproteobacteria bacterium 32-64-14]